MAVGYVWLGSVGTSSDSIPPNATRRAPPAHEVAGDHAIQTYPTTILYRIIIQVLLAFVCN